MEMKKVSAGKLRAIGHDAGTRVLRAEFDDGRVNEYAGVSAETFRCLASSASMWSFFRDNIEDEYTAKRVK